MPGKSSKLKYMPVKCVWLAKGGWLNTVEAELGSDLVPVKCS